jgi:hypothetical protein
MLKERITSILSSQRNRNKKYDCVVGFSGGRDSSYVLWYVVKKLGLKAIAYSADNCYVPEVAMRNMKMISEKLDVRLVIEDNTAMKKCVQHHLKAFMHRPSPAMIGVLCTGCKLGIDMGLLRFATKNNIQLVILGGSPLEVGSYKTGLLRTNSQNNANHSLIKGYLLEVKRNPKWVMRPAAAFVQFQEFYHHYHNKTLKGRVKTFSPFYRYLEWDEKKIHSTLNDELGWEFNAKMNTSTWKTDCYMAPLRKYLYKKMLGYNDIDDHMSALVRWGQINRDEAMRRLTSESSVSDQALSNTCSQLGINRRQLERSICI